MDDSEKSIRLKRWEDISGKEITLGSQQPETSNDETEPLTGEKLQVGPKEPTIKLIPADPKKATTENEPIIDLINGVPTLRIRRPRSEDLEHAARALGVLPTFDLEQRTTIEKAKINFVDGSNPYVVELSRILLYHQDRTFHDATCTYDLLFGLIKDGLPIVVAKKREDDKLKTPIGDYKTLSDLIRKGYIERVINTSSVKDFEPIIEKIEQTDNSGPK